MSYYQLLSAAERNAIVASHLRQHLPSLGLTEITPRTWVDGSKPPVRRMFELGLFKGAAMGARWGFSLDFVPHISGGWVRWHRSDKKAMLDIIIHPRDLPQPSFIHGPARLSEELRALLPEAVSRARETWRRGSTLDGLLDIVRELREGPNTGFGFYNYTQMPLAYAFLSAKTGDLQTAELELDQYVISAELDDDEAAKLKKLAREYAEAGA